MLAVTITITYTLYMSSTCIKQYAPLTDGHLDFAPLSNFPKQEPAQ